MSIDASMKVSDITRSLLRETFSFLICVSKILLARYFSKKPILFNISMLKCNEIARFPSNLVQSSFPRVDEISLVKLQISKHRRVRRSSNRLHNFSPRVGSPACTENRGIRGLDFVDSCRTSPYRTVPCHLVRPHCFHHISVSCNGK